MQDILVGETIQLHDEKRKKSRIKVIKVKQATSIRI
jgi:hypothetical protein